MNVVVFERDREECRRKLSFTRETSHPLICATHVDPRYISALYNDLAREGVRVYSLDTVTGLVSEAGPGGRRQLFAVPTLDAVPDALAAFMEDVEGIEDDVLLVVMLDGAACEQPGLRAPLEALARKIYEQRLRTRVIVRGLADSPWVISFEPIPPKEGDLSRYVDAALDRLGATVSAREKKGVLGALRGLTASSIHRVLDRALEEREPGTGLLEGIEQARREELSRRAGLEVVPWVGADRMGGMEVLKNYLEHDREILRRRNDARRARVALPKGILLVGLPGCGKSLAAKVSASVLQLQLLRLDVGSLMGKYLGESEERMRRALDSVEASAPCVLWIDELEKALGGSTGGEGTGTDTRMLGLLLTWMQENDLGVYVVATANSVEKLPPELLRRGRFDESFFVGLPNEEEREAILKIHLENRDIAPPEQLARVAAETARFSGAELEALVKLVHRQRFVRGEDNELIEDLVREAGQMTPFAKQWEEKLAEMERPLEEQGFKRASLSPGDPPLRKIPKPPLPESLEVLLKAAGPIILRPAGRGWTMELVREEDRIELLFALGDCERVSYRETISTSRLRSNGALLEGKLSRPLMSDGVVLGQHSVEVVCTTSGKWFVRFDESDARAFEIEIEFLPPRDLESPGREGDLPPPLYGCLAGDFALDVGHSRIEFSGRGALREALVSVGGEEPRRYRVRPRGAAILLVELETSELVYRELVWVDGAPRLDQPSTDKETGDTITNVVLDLSVDHPVLGLSSSKASLERVAVGDLPMNTMDGFTNPMLARAWVREILDAHAPQGLCPVCDVRAIVPSHMSPWARASLRAVLSSGLGKTYYVRLFDRGDLLSIWYANQSGPEEEKIVTLHGGQGAVHACVYEVSRSGEGSITSRLIIRSYLYTNSKDRGLEGFFDDAGVKQFVGRFGPKILVASPYPIELPSWARDVGEVREDELMATARQYMQEGCEVVYVSSPPWDLSVATRPMISHMTSTPTRSTEVFGFRALDPPPRFGVKLELVGVGETYVFARRMTIPKLETDGAKKLEITVDYDWGCELSAICHQGGTQRAMKLEHTKPVFWKKR